MYQSIFDLTRHVITIGKFQAMDLKFDAYNLWMNVELACV